MAVKTHVIRLQLDDKGCVASHSCCVGGPGVEYDGALPEDFVENLRVANGRYKVVDGVLKHEGGKRSSASKPKETVKEKNSPKKKK